MALVAAIYGNGLYAGRKKKRKGGVRRKPNPYRTTTPRSIVEYEDARGNVRRIGDIV